MALAWVPRGLATDGALPMPVVHHQRLTGYTACGRPSLGLLLDDYDQVFRPGQPRREVTCRSCLRSLARQPRAADIVFDFADGASVAALCVRYSLTREQVEQAIREGM